MYVKTGVSKTNGSVFQSGSSVLQRSGSVGSDRVLVRGHSALVPAGLPARGPAPGAALCSRLGLKEGMKELKEKMCSSEVKGQEMLLM